MADALSKGDFKRFRWWGDRGDEGRLPLEPLKVPEALLRWVLHPSPDWELGANILRELSLQGPVLGY